MSCKNLAVNHRTWLASHLGNRQSQGPKRSSVSLQLLNPHDQTPNESWPRAWVEWSPGRGASHCTGPRGCSIQTWVMIGGQMTADGHWRLMVISTVWEMVSNFPTTSQLVVDYAEYHMAFWKVLNDVRLIYMLSGCFGAQALSWFTAVIHQLKHVWLHPCHPRSKNVVPQTLGIFTNLVRFPLPKWVSRRFCQHTSNISKFQPIPFCFFCQFTTSTYTFSETGYHVYLSRGVPLFRGSRHPCCHGLDAFRLHVVLSIHCLHLRPWKLQGREKKNRKQTIKNPASIHVPSIKMT